jgi:hypothetical protein
MVPHSNLYAASDARFSAPTNPYHPTTEMPGLQPAVLRTAVLQTAFLRKAFLRKSIVLHPSGMLPADLRQAMQC